MVILLLDDERRFADEREAVIVRTVDDAIKFTETVDVLDELWLDFVLTSGDTLPYLKYLIERKNTGRPVTIGKVIFHSSAYMAMGLVEHLAKQADLPTPVRPSIKITTNLIG